MIEETISKELNIKDWQTKATIDLIDKGNTIPFIARYRKETTGSLDDETLRKFVDRLNYLRNLKERKEQILESISEQGKLTEELKDEIEKTQTLVRLEDIYRPYKPKKRTRATIAKEKGLEGLAEAIYLQETETPIEELAIEYLSEEHKVCTIEEAISGAQDIVAEIISDNADYRKKIRNITYKKGKLDIQAKDNEKSSEYEMYYGYDEDVSKIRIHRVLAINRGEKEEFLKVKIEAPEKEILEFLRKEVINDPPNILCNEILKETIKDAYKRLMAPAIEREVRSYLTEIAEDKSIGVFSKNLEQLIMQGPILDKVVLGWDPGFRTGCKIAVVDEIGKVLDTDVVFPTDPKNQIKETKEKILDWIEKYMIDLIAIGNGTASRESELIIADIIKGSDVKYVIVNEAGASVYSASKFATDEFPDYDVGERSAISIARRLQDPLAELVKIDPKSIGVGQYQHDMNQKKLNESLKSVVEKSVNMVGVDVNTASIALLNYVAGVNSNIAKNIVKYREEEGIFKSREELLSVTKLGPKTYEQCAGFLKVLSSNNPLDITTIHPESYEVTKKLLKKVGFKLEDIGSTQILIDDIEWDKIADELNMGEITLKDIANELKKPGRDPREEMPQPILRTDTLEIEDLEEDMIMQGTIRNVVDFGAFVDIGVHQEGLIHISQIVDDQFVKHPLDFVSVGDIVDVKILDVDVDKKRIQLSMIF